MTKPSERRKFAKRYKKAAQPVKGDVMSSLPSDFRIINVKQAHAAALKAGIDVDRIDINPRTGVISIVPRRPEAEIAKPGKASGKKLREWDE